MCRSYRGVGVVGGTMGVWVYGCMSCRGYYGCMGVGIVGVLWV